MSYVDTYMLYDIDNKYMCIVQDKKLKKMLSRFLLSKCPCRNFVCVEVLSCRDIVCVKNLYMSRFCPSRYLPNIT